MADFDPCECVFNHETAMRRLLSLLRNNQQGFCTESECTSELPGPESDGLSGMNNMFMMLMLWMALALALFFLRPKSLRSQPADKPGPSRDSRDQPPPPADPPAGTS